MSDTKPKNNTTEVSASSQTSMPQQGQSQPPIQEDKVHRTALFALSLFGLDDDDDEPNNATSAENNSTQQPTPNR